MIDSEDSGASGELEADADWFFFWGEPKAESPGFDFWWQEFGELGEDADIDDLAGDIF